MNRYIFVGSLILFVGTVFASEFEYIFGDAQKFLSELKMQSTEINQVLEDSAFQESDLLFLEAEVDEDTNLLESNSIYVIVNVGEREMELTDVPKNTWFAPFVRSAAEKGIVSGYKDEQGVLLGLFGPADLVSIEQLAKMTLGASNVYLSSCNGSILNKSAVGSWSESYILCTEELGWAIYSDGGIDVKKPATRSEVIITIMQAFNVLFESSTGEIFTDVNSSTQFSGAIERAAKDGIVSGFADENGNPTGLFGPSDSVTRAEIAKIVTLAIDVYGG
ncbi:MAG: S-layer homology domain-containing protein [Candidatus Peribacteraceae bacterium]|nr:S-layer homology domain-containing protein [Candidatus Peribacteraceae bacterium]